MMSVDPQQPSTMVSSTGDHGAPQEAARMHSVVIDAFVAAALRPWKGRIVGLEAGKVQRQHKLIKIIL
jgi:hypothetical protein